MFFPLVERLGRRLVLFWCGLITLKLITPGWLVRLTPHSAAHLVAGVYDELIVVFPIVAAILWVLFRARTPTPVRIVHGGRR